MLHSPSWLPWSYWLLPVRACASGAGTRRRNPLRIYRIDSRDEWIVVRGRQDGRVQLAMTRKYFIDDVWKALVAAGAVPASDGPSAPARRHGAGG